MKTFSEPRGAIGGKTDKTAVKPGFFKMERGGGSGGAPSGYRDPCRALPLAPERNDNCLIASKVFKKMYAD